MTLIKFKKAAMFGLMRVLPWQFLERYLLFQAQHYIVQYSKVKVVAITTMMNEFAKAYEQYILDTVSGFPANSVHARDVTAHSLINDTGEAGWNGPYLSYEPIATYSLAINQSSVNAGYYQGQV